MFDENYHKPFHISGSPSVFLDLDSLVYILCCSLLGWLLVRAIQKRKGKKESAYFEFISKYMIVCSLPVFAIYLVTLLLNGKMVLSNWIICFLPLIYGLIIQAFTVFVEKMKLKTGGEKYIALVVIIAIAFVWYHMPISLSYQYAAMDSNGNKVKVDITGKVYKSIILEDKKDMMITIDSSRIQQIPLKVTSGQFVAEEEGIKKSDYGKLFYTQTDTINGLTYVLRISSNQSVIEYAEYDDTGYEYSLYKTGKW